MRRIFIMLTLICAFAIGANAQIVRSTTSEIKKVKVVKPEKPWHHSGFFIDGGIGVLTNGGDLSVDSEGDFAFQAGLGYRWLIGGGVSWEVFRIGYNAGVSDMAASGYVNATTGVRYDSPRLPSFGNKSVYGNFNIGYGTIAENTDDEYYTVKGGLALEFGVGVKLTRNLSLGLFYKCNKDSYELDDYYKDKYYDYDFDEDFNVNWGVFGVKLELQLH